VTITTTSKDVLKEIGNVNDWLDQNDEGGSLLNPSFVDAINQCLGTVINYIEDMEEKEIINVINTDRPEQGKTNNV